MKLGECLNINTAIVPIRFMSVSPHLAQPRKRAGAHRVRKGKRGRVSGYARARASERLHRCGIDSESDRIGDGL